ncbi:MAG: PAS domain-containing protein [Candidatus Kapabacteria bacterium]|nr:PAS domain-containing protein [Ignavibacteriota bacterium]MCW5883921.1 PAS domain-containing protein [Candidatus Kapabacteria bacterium]
MPSKSKKIDLGNKYIKTNDVSEQNYYNDDNFPIAGVGASAGGLEALEQFFKNIKPDSGLGYVVVQHLSPDYKSLMVELLGKHTSIPIYRAEDGMKVQKNSIYLIPPKKNLTIFHRKLYLTDQSLNLGLNLPIDIFLRSLAEDLAERSIGIVLSGTGSDGTLGIRAIKGAGGMVMVQDEETAKFDGMPKSAIATGLVDYILPPYRMGEQLLKYVEHPFLKASDKKLDIDIEENDVISKILLAIRARTGVDFTYYKPNTIVRRIERRSSVHHIPDIEDYYRLVSDSPTEVNVLYKELLIGVTKFFRDSEAFELVKEKVIPRLFESKVVGESIRVWVPGCSTGEEAYTLAILLREYMNLIEREYDIKIFATDIDKDAIEYASMGTYPESIVTDISEDHLRKYFTKNGSTFKVVDSIRQMVIFATHNLIKDPPFSKIDLVSCRNLLIYFQPVMQKKVLSSFGFSLSNGGILFLGSSESIGELSSYFNVIDNKWKIYKSNEKILHPIMDVLHLPHSSIKMFPAHQDKRSKIYSDSDLLDSINKELFNDFVPPSIIINEKYELIHVFKDANKFMKLPSGKVSLNILNMVPQELSVALGTAIHRAIKEQGEIVYKDISFMRDDKSVSLNLIVKMFKHDKTKNNMMLIIFEETGNAENSLITSELFDIGSNVNQRLFDLEGELKYTKENLQATIEELETSNEELQATNEELIASNEELQSTNEELQSVNEELYTVNSEYQNKIEELTELNNDINNWFNVTNIGTIFLDLKLKIRKFTPATKYFVNLIEDDIGRPISHISYNFVYNEFINQINLVLKTLNPFEIELKSTDEKWFLLKVLPYRTVENAIKGIVITFIDIDKIKSYELQIRRDNEFLSRILENSPNAKVMHDANGKISYANKKAVEILELSPSELKGKKYNDPKFVVCYEDGSRMKEEDFPFNYVMKNNAVINNKLLKMKFKNDVVKSLLVNASPMFDINNNIEAVLISFVEY